MDAEGDNGVMEREEHPRHEKAGAKPLQAHPFSPLGDKAVSEWLAQLRDPRLELLRHGSIGVVLGIHARRQR